MKTYIYDLDDYSSNKYPDKFISSNDMKILIHKGDFGSETVGCIMPGSKKVTNMIGSSTKKWENCEPL